MGSGGDHLVVSISPNQPWVARHAPQSKTGCVATLHRCALIKRGTAAQRGRLGKWHLGFYQRAFTPLARGFDEHLGYYQGEVDYYAHTGACRAPSNSTPMGVNPISPAHPQRTPHGAYA